MEKSGTIKVIGEVKEISDKLSVRQFVVTTLDEDYPQHLTFQLYGNKTALLDYISLGTGVIVKFNLKGKEWINKETGEIKHFNTLDAYAIEFTGKKKPKEEEEDDYLPF